jgi:hypothetical protein
MGVIKSREPSEGKSEKEVSDQFFNILSEWNQGLPLII